MKIQMHKRRFAMRGCPPRHDDEPYELLWHRRWPGELHLECMTWSIPGAQNPTRVVWRHAGLRFWAAGGGGFRNGVAVVVHSPAVEAELGKPRYVFEDVSQALRTRRMDMGGQELAATAIRFPSDRIWVGLRRTPTLPERHNEGLAFWQAYRHLNVRLIWQATQDIVRFIEGKAPTRVASMQGRIVPSWIDEAVLDTIEYAARLRNRHGEPEDHDVVE